MKKDQELVNDGEFRKARKSRSAEVGMHPRSDVSGLKKIREVDSDEYDGIIERVDELTRPQFSGDDIE